MWTYDIAKLTNDDKSGVYQLRLMVQDVIEDDPLLQDEEIAFYLSYNPPTAGKPAWLAAAVICDTLALKFAQDVQNSIGPISEAAQQRYEHYVALGQMFRTLYATNGKGSIPGTLGATPAGIPILGGGGPTYLGPNSYLNPLEN